MITLPKGIIEFVGESGTGKTKLALAINKSVNTLYLSMDKSGTPQLLENVIPIYLKSFIELKVFIALEVKKLVKTLNIRKIILDGLENYLYIVEQPRKTGNEIFRIIKVLKYLCFIENIQIIIINSSYGKWINDGVQLVNRYFGLPWEYMINYRYLISRNGEYRRIEAVNTKKIVVKDFILGDTDVKFIEN